MVVGYSAEKQLSKASSTRQELMAQLCIEYWVDHLIRRIGEPGYQLAVTLVTDSKASIDILEQIPNKIGLKEFLQPDTDVAMEVAALRSKNSCRHTETIKVNGHIDIEEAPDEFHWRLNDEADKLATLAREKVENGLLEASRPVLLPKSKVVCSISGILCINNMNVHIHQALTSTTIQEYLCNKYSWTVPVFSKINWTAHQLAIAQYQSLQQVTVMKYVHGWLATKKRRWRDGEFSTPLCLVCNEVEDSRHMFCCQYTLTWWRHGIMKYKGCRRT